MVVTGWNAASPQYFPPIPELPLTSPHFSTLPHTPSPYLNFPTIPEQAKVSRPAMDLWRSGRPVLNAILQLIQTEGSQE